MRSVLATSVLVASSVLFASMMAGCGGGGGGGSSSCDTLGARSARVTGGEQCEGGESPVVALIVLDRFGRVKTCSGTMISVTTVLTAGHCFDDAVAARLFSQTRLLAAGGEYLVHPLWRVAPVAGNPYDIGMLKISTPTNIGPVPLLFGDDLEVNESITIFGYGLDENNEDLIDRLQNGEAALKAGEMKVAAIQNGLFGATFDDTGSAVCQGDSGGPAIQISNGVSSLVGITSFNKGGCESGSISGFVNIQRPDVIDFILGFAPDAVVR